MVDINFKEFFAIEITYTAKELAKIDKMKDKCNGGPDVFPAQKRAPKHKAKSGTFSSKRHPPPNTIFENDSPPKSTMM